MSFHFANIAREAASDREITMQEISDLRRAGWSDGQMQREEAEALFRVQDALRTPTEQWTDFFIEAICNFVLNSSEPRGYIAPQDVHWLIAQIEADGRICSIAELELLVQTIEKAHNAPDDLKEYILDIIEEEVLTGTGPTRGGAQLSEAHVTAAEAQLIRRVIFAQASKRPAAVSRCEAEMLFRIKDAVASRPNAPEFQQLFVQGVGNYLMGFASQSGQISRERAMELEAFMADRTSNVGRFLGKMARSAPAGFRGIFKKAGAHTSRDAKHAQARALTSEEQEWLDRQVDANGEVDAFDAALLAFLAEENGPA